MGLEIEKKFIVKKLPENLDKYPVHVIEQGYLCVIPAIRVRREDDRYYMTYKSNKGFGKADTDAGADGIGKTEYNLPLDKDSYEHLVKKADGNVIRKKRYIIPLNEDAFDEEYINGSSELKSEIAKMKIELDVFDAPFDGRVLAEVEFPDERTAREYHPAEWFLEDVTGRPEYSNAQMSREKL